MEQNYLVYIPPQYREHNYRSSCVYASVANCLRFANLCDVADKFWDTYKGAGPCNPDRISNALNKFNIKYKIVRSEQSLINSLASGRGAAVTWGGAHCVNLVGKINGNAYIIDNERPQRYVIHPWQQFLSSFKRSGSWAVIILSGRSSKPIERKNLDGFKN